MHIEDYAIIGDLGTAALVRNNGSLDLGCGAGFHFHTRLVGRCGPEFDSDACLAALLGKPENGRWRVAPKDENARVTRQYRDSTLILETRFETSEGAATLIDFMPPRGGNSHLIRVVKGERGNGTFCR